MKTWQVLVITALAVASLHLINQQTVPASAEFEAWQTEYGVHFDAQEEPYRRMIFIQNLKEITTHNTNSKNSYSKGTNQFTHLSHQEFAQMFLSSIYYRENRASIPREDNNLAIEPLREIDWQALGKISGVKDQGTCDAGYAFSSASLIESFYLLDNKNLSLSEQQIVDCSASYTTFGCQSGSRNGTLTFIREKGLTTSAQYPYKGVKNNCQREVGEYKPAYTHVEFNGCTDISSALYASPLSVAVNAKDWQSYRAGVYDGCTSTEVNHDILLIGQTAGNWRLKNSWGVRWGEFGYIRLKIGNTCGICEKPAFGFKR